MNTNKICYIKIFNKSKNNIEKNIKRKNNSINYNNK